MARIIAEAGVQIEPETAGFASELRGDLSRDMAAATAGLDRTVRIRVATDADAAEAQIRAGLTRIQQATNQLFDRTRARAQTLYTFLEQRVVVRLANKIREWTQKTVARVKLLMQPFWQLMARQLQTLQRAWGQFREFVSDAADRVAQKWRQGLAVMSAQLSRVRQAAQSTFRGVADAARDGFARIASAVEPHLARVRRGIERLSVPFRVVGAYGVATFRILGQAAQAGFARIRSVGEAAFDRVRAAGQRMGSGISSAFTAATRPLRDFRSGMRDVMSALDEGATKSTKFGALTRLAMVRAAQGIITAAVRFGDFSDRVSKGEGLIRLAGQKIGSSFRFMGDVLTDTNRAAVRFGDGMKRAGDRVSGTSRVSRLFGGVLSGVGSVFSAVGSVGERLSGVFGKLEDGLVGLGGKGAELLQQIPQLVQQFAKWAVIGGAVTYVLGAVAAAVVALPGLLLGAAAALGVVVLGMDGIKKAYDRGLKPALDQLKKQISDVFEQKLTPAFQKLSTQLLPQITDKLKTLATSVADVGVHLVDLVTKGENVAKINKVIDTMAQIIASQVDPALQKLIQSFIDLGSNAQILNAIGGMFTDLIGKTADWLAEMNRTGEATRAVESLRSVMGHLEDLFFRVATAAAKFFSDATPGVNKLVDSSGRLVDMVGRMGGAFGDAAAGAAALIDSIPQSTLDAIVDAVDRLGQKLKEAGNNKDLQRVLQQIADQLPGIIDGVTQFVDAVENIAGAYEQVQYSVAKADEFLGTTNQTERDLIKTHEATGDAATGMGDDTKAAADKANSALGTIPPKADEAGKGIEDGVKPPVERIPGVVDSATGQVSFQPVLDAANQAFGQLPTTVADGVNKSVDSMTQGSDKIKASAEAGFTAAATAASTNMVTIGDVVEERMQAAAQSAEVGGTRIGDGIRNGVQSAADSAQAGMGRVGESVRTAMDTAAQTAESGGQRIATAITDNVNRASDAAQSGMARLSEAVRTGIDQAAQAAQSGMDKVAQAVQQGMDRAADAARAGGDRVADAVRAGADRAADAARAGMDRVVDAVTAAMARAAAAAQAGGDRIRAAVQAAFTGVTSVVTAAMAATVAVITAGMARCVQAVTQGMTQIRTVYTQSFQQIVQVVTQAWQRIVQAFQQGGQRAVQISVQTGQQILQTFTALAGPMYSAGFQIISRLAAGMIAAQGQAFAAAASTAAGIRARFPASPAKTGPLSGSGDPLRSGGMIVERLAAGMTANAAAVQAALQPILAGLVGRVNAVSAAPSLALPGTAGVQPVGGPLKGGSLEDFVRAATPTSPAGAGESLLAELKAQTAQLMALRGDVSANGYSASMLERLDTLIDTMSDRGLSAGQRASALRDLAGMGAF